VVDTYLTVSGVDDAPEAVSPHVTCVYPLVAAVFEF